jgi:hypothetical protein
MTKGTKIMRNSSGRLFQSFLLSFCVALLATTAWAQDKVTPAEARKIAREAYIFNYPLVMMYRTMYLQAIDTKSKSYSGGFGKWLHLGTSSPKDTDIVSPNNDSPYSYAWVGSICASMHRPKLILTRAGAWAILRKSNNAFS